MTFAYIDFIKWIIIFISFFFAISSAFSLPIVILYVTSLWRQFLFLQLFRKIKSRKYC